MIMYRQRLSVGLRHHERQAEQPSTVRRHFSYRNAVWFIDDGVGAAPRSPSDNRMPQLLVNGLEVFYRDEGSGEPVLLAHCSTGSGAQ